MGCSNEYKSVWKKKSRFLLAFPKVSFLSGHTLQRHGWRKPCLVVSFCSRQITQGWGGRGVNLLHKNHVLTVEHRHSLLTTELNIWCSSVSTAGDDPCQEVYGLDL